MYFALVSHSIISTLRQARSCRLYIYIYKILSQALTESRVNKTGKLCINLILWRAVTTIVAVERQ